MHPKSPHGQHLTDETSRCTKYPGKHPHASMPRIPSLLIIVIELCSCGMVVQLRHNPVAESGYIPSLGHTIGTQVSGKVDESVVAGLHTHKPPTAILSLEQIYATAVPLHANPNIQGP
jgi:hypothetical protein